MRKTLTIVVCGALALGCGGDTTNPDGAVTVATGCGSLADALCTRFQTCTNGFAVTVTYGDVATCVRRATLSCTTGAGLAGSALTGDSLQRCATSAGALTCDQLFAGATPAGCEIPGTLAVGAACAVNVQCQSRYCARPSGASCSTCQVAPTVGSSCANGLGCGPGSLACAGTTCQQDATEGAACTATAPCVGGLACEGGTCRRPPSTAGAVCDAQLGCQLSAGLYCDPMTRVCTAFTYATGGQMCGVVSGRFVVCANASCEGGMGRARPGTCTAYAADNAPCNTVDGPRCQTPAECIPTSGASGAGTCRIPGSVTCR